MRKTHKEFDSRIFLGYLKYFDISILEGTLMNSTYKKLTHNMLLLRFFGEVNAHKKNIPMYDVFIYEVFEKYTIEKCSRYSQGKSGINHERLNVLLDKIISRMIENHEYSSISTEGFTVYETELLKKLLENEVIFKGEDFVKTGLVPKQIETIGFTFDEYRDFCITNYIITNYDENALFQFMYQIEQEKSPICEGVQKYLFYLAHTKYKEDLNKTVKKISGYEKLYWRHIWSIDEQFIDKNDLNKINEQILRNTDYMSLVIRNMIHRYDCTYYQKINIKILMGIFDKLEEASPKQYDCILCRFPYIDDTNHWHYELEKDAIYRLDSILQKLHQDITESIPIERYIELMKFTIYLFSNDELRICELWGHFYRYSKEKAYEVLSDMNSHRSHAIQNNTASIISSILEGNIDSDLQELLDNNCYHIKNDTSFRDYFTRCIKDLENNNEDF